MNMNTSEIIDRLKSCTLSLHSALEARYPFSCFSAESMDMSDYLAVLSVLAVFHQELESGIARLIPEPCLAQLAYQPMSTLLCRDLREQTVIVESGVRWEPVNQAQAMGGLYVMTGSSAGASRMFNRLGAMGFVKDGVVGIDYYSSLASRHGFWQEFVRCFGHSCIDREYATADVCEGAIKAFEFLLTLCDVIDNPQSRHDTVSMSCQ